jgi:hypothetical protein
MRIAAWRDPGMAGGGSDGYPFTQSLALNPRFPMLDILGQLDNRAPHGDRWTRRGFLRVGGMAAGGLSLPQLLSADQQAGNGRSHKAIINIYLPGGPSHLDMFDLKPDAPAEVRGEFRPDGTAREWCDVDVLRQLRRRSLAAAHAYHPGDDLSPRTARRPFAPRAASRSRRLGRGPLV